MPKVAATFVGYHQDPRCSSVGPFGRVNFILSAISRPAGITCHLIERENRFEHHCFPQVASSDLDKDSAEASMACRRVVFGISRLGGAADRNILCKHRERNSAKMKIRKSVSRAFAFP